MGWISNWNPLSLPDNGKLGSGNRDVIQRLYDMAWSINSIAAGIASGSDAMQDQMSAIQLTPGPAGPAGPQGAPGSQGSPGAAGSAGSAGAAATVSIGTVTTLAPGASATASNVGTSAAAVINLGIPAGAAGAGGAAGTPGAAGVNAFGTPVAVSSPAYATAYQAATPSKPAEISATIEAIYTVTVANTQQDTVELRMGPVAADVLAGTNATVVAASFNARLTGLSITIGMVQVNRNQIVAHLPTGWYYALVRTVNSNGTATIQALYSQPVG